ncbi:MAG: cation:proton antiporter [Methanospirillaceae archaeon]|nr:cation:proton antiporter [Methanospirillaceae archaeon]
MILLFPEPFEICVLVLAVLILVALYRLVAGPTSPDRVVALDAINTLVVGIMFALGVIFRENIFVDVAILYAVLSFIGTIYYAWYIGGRYT